MYTALNWPSLIPVMTLPMQVLFSPGRLAQVPGVRQNGLEELQRDDFNSVVHDRVNAGHAHVLKHFQVLEVVR